MMSTESSDTNGDSPFECLDSRDSNGSLDSPKMTGQKVTTLEAVHENTELLGLQEAMNKLVGENEPEQEVPEKLFLLNLKPESNEDVKGNEVVHEKTQPIEKKVSTPSRSPSPKGEGFLNWIAGNGFLNRVAEKAKSSVDTMITTLDPGMKAYLYSGGDANILVASDKESKIGPVREAFIDVFGRATVKGISAESASIAAQPVGPGCAQYAASERISSTRLFHQHDVPQNQTMVSVEGFLVEMTPESWFEMSCLLLEDPLSGLRIITYTQATPVPCEAINYLTFETPNDYPLKSTGFSVTIGQIMSQKLGVSHEEWHEKLTGIPRRSTIYLAACSLARLFKDRINRQSSN